jgi:hypothetical protein
MSSAIISGLLTPAVLMILVTDLGVWYLILSSGAGIVVYLLEKRK